MCLIRWPSAAVWIDMTPDKLHIITYLFLLFAALLADHYLPY